MPENRAEGRPGPILLISASDSSGAAGAQVDIRVADALDMPLRCALTAVTVQGDGGVLGVFPVPAEVLGSSMRTSFEDPPGISAVKIGMLVGAQTVSTVVEHLKPLSEKGVPMVLDPVVRSTSGSSLVDEEGIDLLLEGLLPMCTVVTPNREEAAWLAFRKGDSRGEAGQAAQVLLSLGAGAVLVTGGEGRGKTCTDNLYTAPGSPIRFRHERLGGPVPRGTGCALSTAIAAHLALGRQLDEAVEEAVGFVVSLIRGSKVTGNQRLLFP